MSVSANLALLSNPTSYRFGRPAGPGPLTPDIAPTTPDTVRTRLAAILRRAAPGRRTSRGPAPSGHAIEDLAPGLRFGTPYGETYVVRETLRHGECHGERTPRTMLDRDVAPLLALCGVDPDAAGAPRNPRRWLFLDTEATGLAGWAGNLAFVVAFGYFGREGFVVDQYLVRGFEEEAAALHHAAETARSFDAVVSFNGRSFDGPLLRARARMNRVREALGNLAHLDLLHPARRIFGPRLPDCRLQTLEREVLGLRRLGDLPGHMVPPAYFEFLHTADARPLVEILRHNRADVRSLATLAGALLDACDTGCRARLWDGLAPDDGERAGLEVARAHGRMALALERGGADVAASLHHAARGRDLLVAAGAPEPEQATAARRVTRIGNRLGRAAKGLRNDSSGIRSHLLPERGVVDARRT